SAITAVHDTPGQLRFWTRVEEALTARLPHVVVVVVADGYLENKSTGRVLMHPCLSPKPKVYKSLPKYVAAARELELGWVEQLADHLTKPRRPSVKYCVLFVNKMELWYPSPQSSYEGTDFAKALNTLASKLSRRGTSFTVVTGSAQYDG